LHTTQLLADTGFINNRIEIKKNFIYEQGYESSTLAVYVIENKCNKTDKKLQ